MTSAFKGKGALPRLQTSWDLRAACNFIGGGTGTGLLITTALLALFGYPYFGAIILGLACVGFGLFMVWLEIGRPWRSMNLFFHPETSWMTREGILAIPMFLLGALTIFYYPQSSVAAVIGIIAAGYLYCQARMLRGAKGIPSWAHPSLTPYILATGLTEGMGLAICFQALASEALLAVFAVLLILRLITWSRYSKGLQQSGAPQASCAAINNIRSLFLVGGHLLPIILLVIVTFASELRVVLVPAAGLLAAMAGWLSKAVIITRAAQTRGFAIPRTPIRGQGSANEASSQASKQGW
ncbi:MAG: hypothetical protein K9K86_03045 [Pseudomonadales bacterium]|nr:hypothetical protein [Pseudomonadales bacterium]